MASIPIPSKTITVEGTTLTLAVERKRVKNVNAQLRGSTLFISAPPDLPSKRLHQIATEMARKLVRRAHAQKTNSEDDALALTAKVARRFPQPPSVERVVCHYPTGPLGQLQSEDKYHTP